MFDQRSETIIISDINRVKALHGDSQSSLTLCVLIGQMQLL